VFQARRVYRDVAPIRCCQFDPSGKNLAFGTNKGLLKVIQVEKMLEEVENGM